MLDIFAPGGRFIAPYLFEVSTALIACSLVVLGADINRLLRNALRDYKFRNSDGLLYTTQCIWLWLIIIKATPLLKNVLVNTEPGLMFAIVVLSFVSIGIWAQRNRQI